MEHYFSIHCSIRGDEEVYFDAFDTFDLPFFVVPGMDIELSKDGPDLIETVESVLLIRSTGRVVCDLEDFKFRNIEEFFARGKAFQNAGFITEYSTEAIKLREQIDRKK